jgi:hypothetical protein
VDADIKDGFFGAGHAKQGGRSEGKAGESHTGK